MVDARPAAGFADLTACNVVLTSLPDDDPLTAVALGGESLACALAPGAVHISTSMVSPEISRGVGEEHARHRQDYVATRCVGTPISLVSASSPCLLEARPRPWKRSALYWSDLGSGCSWSAKTWPQRTL